MREDYRKELGRFPAVRGLHTSASQPREHAVRATPRGQKDRTAPRARPPRTSSAGSGPGEPPSSFRRPPRPPPPRALLRPRPRPRPPRPRPRPCRRRRARPGTCPRPHPARRHRPAGPSRRGSCQRSRARYGHGARGDGPRQGAALRLQPELLGERRPAGRAGADRGGAAAPAGRRRRRGADRGASRGCSPARSAGRPRARAAGSGRPGCRGVGVTAEPRGAAPRRRKSASPPEERCEPGCYAAAAPCQRSRPFCEDTSLPGKTHT